MQWRGHTCIYPLEEAILCMLGSPFPTVSGVKVLREELHFLLQHLHRLVWNALRNYQHMFPHVLAVNVGLVAALLRHGVILFRVLF